MKKQHALWKQPAVLFLFKNLHASSYCHIHRYTQVFYLDRTKNSKQIYKTKDCSVGS